MDVSTDDCIDPVRLTMRCRVPRCKLMMLFHIIHDVFERLFLVDIHPVAYLLLILPVVNHFWSHAPYRRLAQQF